ncbi:hypothetical protein CBR_g39609 [Chara braunii]|uniref:Retrotransposon gag domain-containing protein n=1 Tax=Chara braunii TaxID=69332 RepID=A0A388K1C2_CHABU|nr:hypothetical protein CBR_g39609 [Chara braunii]|eukprot:GBG63825.1 hypothetical protein CBR_g39609 [Chara braunii]
MMEDGIYRYRSCRQGSQEAAEAKRQRLANEAAAQAQQTAEADAAARDQRNAASTESLIHSESQWTTFLQGMIFVPSDAQADPTPAEAERTHLANLMLGMMRGIMWNNTLLQAHLRTERQQRQKHQQDIVVLTTAIRAEATQQQQQHQLLNSALARINSIEANASAAPGCTTDATKQLNERIDHVVTIIGDIGVFNGPDTISSTVAAIKTDITKLQTRPDAATKTYKMPHFDISKFDDYNKSDALTWWQCFLTEASCRTVPTDDMMKALYLQLIGGAQAWMNHLAATNKCAIADLHTHITWNEFEKLWFTRFMVHNAVKAAMNEVYTCSQGNMPTRDWTTKWQKIVTTPGFDLSFPNQGSEFFLRSCAGLRSALGNEYDYDTFQAILDRANLVIQTDDKAANERQSQPHYVAKQGYQQAVRTYSSKTLEGNWFEERQQEVFKVGSRWKKKHAEGTVCRCRRIADGYPMLYRLESGYNETFVPRTMAHITRIKLPKTRRTLPYNPPAPGTEFETTAQSYNKIVAAVVKRRAAAITARGRGGGRGGRGAGRGGGRGRGGGGRRGGGQGGGQGHAKDEEGVKECFNNNYVDYNKKSLITFDNFDQQVWLPRDRDRTGQNYLKKGPHKKEQYEAVLPSHPKLHYDPFETTNRYMFETLPELARRKPPLPEQCDDMRFKVGYLAACNPNVPHSKPFHSSDHTFFRYQRFGGEFRDKNLEAIGFLKWPQYNCAR